MFESNVNSCVCVHAVPIKYSYNFVSQMLTYLKKRDAVTHILPLRKREPGEKLGISLKWRVEMLKGCIADESPCFAL